MFILEEMERIRNLATVKKDTTKQRPRNTELCGCQKEKEVECYKCTETQPLQALQFIKAELLKTQKSISELQVERKLLRKQLSCWTGAVQVLQESQEDHHCRIEAQIRMLATSNECMKKELEELRHNSQVVRQFSKLKHRIHGKAQRFHNSINWAVCDLNTNGTSVKRSQTVSQDVHLGLRRENDHLRARNKQTLTHMRHLCESVKTFTSCKENGTLGIQQCERTDEITEKSSFSIQDVMNKHFICEPQESSGKNEEAKLQELIEKLKETLSLQIQSGPFHTGALQWPGFAAGHRYANDSL
ncbi:dystrotelin isoform X2 [Hyperolius riggenbachi]|uniref:dystrotelin isoform X2 n=1 Tax=Hyperolius riggenbachi TaxID=752182 RepID=UPI0035A33DBD